MKIVLQTVSLTLVTFSTLVLMVRGFEIDLSRALQFALDIYENLLRALLGWAEPLLERLWAPLSQYLGWGALLYPHWKHVFVLMWRYFGNLAMGYAKSEVGKWVKVPFEPDPSIDYHEFRLVPRMWFQPSSTAIFLFFWGGAVALCTAVAVGVVPITSGDVTPDVMVMVPILAFVVFELGRSIWLAITIPVYRGFWGGFLSFFRQAALPMVIIAGIGLVLATQIDRLPLISTQPTPGLAFVAAFVIAVGLWEILRNALFATAYHKGKGETWWVSFSKDNIGLAILNSFAPAFLILVVNRLLASVGL